MNVFTLVRFRVCLFVLAFVWVFLFLLFLFDLEEADRVDLVHLCLVSFVFLKRLLFRLVKLCRFELRLVVVVFTVILVIVVSILVDLTFAQINDVPTRSVLSTNLWQYAAVLPITLVG